MRADADEAPDLLLGDARQVLQRQAVRQGVQDLVHARAAEHLDRPRLRVDVDDVVQQPQVQERAPSDRARPLGDSALPQGRSRLFSAACRRTRASTSATDSGV